MKLYSTENALFLVQQDSVLRCCKDSGRLEIVPDFQSFNNGNEISEVGVVCGLIGVLRLEDASFLLLIGSMSAVASLSCTEEKIFHVDKVYAVLIQNKKLDVVLEENGNSFVKVVNQQKRLLKFIGDKVASTRLIDEVLRLFNNDGDFYVSFGRSLTLNTQSYCSGKITVDDRFFWNRSLLNDFYDEDNKLILGASAWVSPVCQGFVCESTMTIDGSVVTLTLISRRSVERAGVRYLRRGIDSDGKVRGSVPVFWTQKGYRYRPPLIIEKPFAESFAAFDKHLDNLLALYGFPVVVVCLLDQTGRELELALSYLQHVLKKDSPLLGFYAFDFHFHCRALRFHKVDELISALNKQLKSVSFCWVDDTNRMVCRQTGIIRTNCVDCLDRTNIVQGAISQAVCLMQLQKLGLLGPLSGLPEEFVRILQNSWADNGDAVSRQYAGTNALKGDVTRNGQRGLVGIMRDGYNSASRYYYSHMKDAQRQLAIDTLLGNSLKKLCYEASDDINCLSAQEQLEEESENIGRLVNETARFLLDENEMLVGGWALVDGCNFSDQIDTVLLLTKSRVLLAFFDDDTENLLHVQSIPLLEVKLVELGAFGKSSKIHFRLHISSTQHHTLKAAKTRLFNNVAIPIKSEEEANEYVQAIVEQLRTTISMCGGEVSVTNVGVLTDSSCKKRSRIINLFTSVFRPKVHFSKYAETKNKDITVPSNRPGYCDNADNDPVLSSSDVEVLASNSVGTDVSLKQSFLCPAFNNPKMSSSKSQSAMDSLIVNDVLPRSGPFMHYRQQVLNSKSRILFL